MADNSQSEERGSFSDPRGASQTWKPLLAIGAVVMVAALIFGENSTVAEDGSVLADSRNFNELAVLGGVKKRDLSSDFAGGKASAVMGGVELDLRNATMEREEALLEVSSVMGGVKIRVPNSWTIVSHVDTILGGFQDNTRHPREEEHRLVIDGTVFMGGLEISN